MSGMLCEILSGTEVSLYDSARGFLTIRAWRIRQIFE